MTNAAGSRRRVVAGALALVLLLAACSGGGDDDDAARDPFDRSDEDEPTTTTVADTDDAIALADAWIDEFRSAEEGLVLAGTRRSLGVTHVRYRQVFDDVPVRAALLIVHVGDDGEIIGASDSLTTLRPAPDVVQQLDEPAAVEVANKAVPEEVTETTAADIVWLPDGDDLRLGWSVQMTTALSSFTVWVDAVTGEVADSRETRLESGVPARFGGARSAAQAGDGCEDEDGPGVTACLFVPDPVVAAGGTAPPLAQADDFRQLVEMQGLDDPASGALVGEFVDLEPASDPNPPVREPDGDWDQGSGDPGFESAMAYFWIDAAQRQIQALGFDEVRNEPMRVIARESREVDNAFFDPAADEISLGVGSPGRPDAAEDAQVLLHEYGHAVLHAQSSNLIFNTGAGAYHEGFGDAFAGLLTLDLSDEPACLFPWFLGDFGPAGCGRRLDTDKVFPDDMENEVHADGEIWTGAVFDILESLLSAEGLTLADCAGTDDCDAVRDRVLGTVIGANEFLTGAEDYPEIALAFVLANAAGFDGADAELIEGAFADHGLTPGGDGIVVGDGTPTGDGPAVQVSIDISHPFRGDLRVQVGVVDADFADLCAPISLLEPGPDDLDDVTGVADLSRSPCAAFVPPSPDQQWVLLVEDTAPADVGQVNAFSVVVEGAPFLATGVPAPIADADPTGTSVIVNASGDAVPQEGEQAPDDTADGAVSASILIEHTFVGDLQVRAGASDPTSGEVLCSVPILEPDPQDDSDDVTGMVDVSACAAFFPPSATALWFLEVVDTAAVDVGTIERFDLFDAGGTLVGSATVPVPIPDDDPAGAIARVAA